MSSQRICNKKSILYIVTFPQKVNFVTRVTKMSWKSSILINTVLTVMVFNNVITAIASVLLCRLVFGLGNKLWLGSVDFALHHD